MPLGLLGCFWPGCAHPGVQTRICVGEGKQGPEARTGCPSRPREGAVGGKGPVMQAPPALEVPPVLKTVTTKLPESQTNRAALICIDLHPALVHRDAFFPHCKCNMYVILRMGGGLST